MFGTKVITYTEFHSEIFSGNFMQQSLEKFPVSLRPQKFHRCFVVGRKTKLKIAAFDSKPVRWRHGASQKSFLRRTLRGEQLPQLHRIDISVRLLRLIFWR